ncbi:2-hydroxy-6-oxo-6-phenylhexa-2,4-dienoate hydrolase [Mycobacterium paraense]|uniref:2-hydroxy-6-oxo-6-phenylhexa-2,4-dienoate hydrolase n=1 Tax=Mycobacterium paraense TaxID=767916 RepID=A0ABX3VTB5_9MYCO|nr:alpha/beta hydrolase [Mycobacterium paraense]ORW32742.1 2-hydroxy-6-oxo-6-phenylhexa-2,4-dienoate hydrolase [Mycobacterium paraense]ORW44967.1 2-hydroxy-6-oxo-6-phenylhexa-2,4-dienoate hydrolase [Mycobacterium paraense]
MPLTEEGLVHIPGLLSRWVRLASGCSAHYMTAGETGPAVILLHGGMWGASGGAGWSHMAPFLGANGFRVYCPDFPGFGLTEGYENVYAVDLSGHLDFLHEFVTALRLDQFHIAGNSMGCQNAVNYVTAHPKQIRSFALISGAVEDLVPIQEMLARLPKPTKEVDRSIMSEFDGTEASMRRIMEWLVDDPSKIDDDVVTMRTLAATKHLDYYRKLNEHLIFKSPDPDTQARMSIKGRFDRLSIPGIYLYGTEDHLPPEVGGHPQEDALPNVQFFYPEDTGHQGQTDSPELFNRVFLEFFGTGKVSWDTAQAAGISTRRPPLPHIVSVPVTAHG